MNIRSLVVSEQYTGSCKWIQMNFKDTKILVEYAFGL